MLPLIRSRTSSSVIAIVLVPATPQEMLDSAMLSFELAFKYRNPVVILGDGYLGQMTGKVRLPEAMIKPGIPAWAVNGDAAGSGADAAAAGAAGAVWAWACAASGA